VREAPAETC